MSHVDITPSRTEVRSDTRSTRAGINLIVILAAVVGLALLAWYLFSGPLANLNSRSIPLSNTTVVSYPAAQQQPVVPPATAATEESAASVCADSGCHLPPMQLDNSAAMGTSYLTPVEMDLVFATPVASSEELGKVMEGLARGGGIGLIRSDGARLYIQYDTAVVDPPAVRQRLAALGHPATAGTEVKDAGDATD